jgi:hypothetical protein
MERIMRCSYCSAENPPDEVFCTSCGSPLKEMRQPEIRPRPEMAPITEIQCPHCGKMHPSHISSCPETGGDLPRAGVEARPAVVMTAKFTMEDGSEIVLAPTERVVGRYDFDRFVSAEDLPYISKKHLTVTFENDTFYIEDSESKNGTLLNGTEIKGAGRQALKNGDRIELGKVVGLLFKLS